jgi:hypothetical protein
MFCKIIHLCFHTLKEQSITLLIDECVRLNIFPDLLVVYDA